MKKKLLKALDFILNIVMVLSVGLLFCYGVYRFWDYKTHPELYIPYSAPWYLPVQIYGILTAVILVVLFAIKSGVRKKLNQS